MGDEPLDHIRRAPLPWRPGNRDLTECGRPANDVAGNVLEHQDMAAKIRKHGKTRCAYSTCVTCWHTAARSAATWEDDPINVLYREMSRVGYHHFQGQTREGEDAVLERELRALGALAIAHADEFTSLVEGLSETASLAEARLKRARARR